MDNMEYIKSLEDRIEKLEKLIASLKLDNFENITLSNCQIQGVGLEKCKNVVLKEFTVDNLGFAAYKSKIESATIHNFQSQNGKVRITNCTINNAEK